MPHWTRTNVANIFFSILSVFSQILLTGRWWSWKSNFKIIFVFNYQEFIPKNIDDSVVPSVRFEIDTKMSRTVKTRLEYSVHLKNHLQSGLVVLLRLFYRLKPIIFWNTSRALLCHFQANNKFLIISVVRQKKTDRSDFVSQCQIRIEEKQQIYQI